MIDTLMADLRLAIRSLRQHPLFTLVAASTLALGIGANTAVFSVVNAVLLTPPPFEQPERLMIVKGTGEMPLSYPTYADLQSRNGSFESLGAWTPYGSRAFTLTGNGEPERVPYAMGTATLFTVLRTHPVQGRTFSAAEDQFGAPARVAMITSGLWKRRFAGDPQVVGSSIVLDGTAYTVVGILPPDFNFVAYPAAPDIWIPLAADPISPGRHYGRGVQYLGVVGRLKAAQTAETTGRDMERISQQLNGEYPGSQLALRGTFMQEAAAGPLRNALMLLLGAVGLVLLIACANVANLQLARASAREHDTAVRLALGASRLRLVRASLTESLVLAVIGGGAGVLLATWGVQAFAALPIFGPPSPLRPYIVASSGIAVDWRVLAFTLVASVATGMLFGALPALHGARDPGRAAAGGGRGNSHRRVGRALVAGEIALAMILLCSAGVLVQSLARLAAVDPGFRSNHVLSLDLSLARGNYREPAQMISFVDQLSQRVAALPGVQSVGIIDQPPLGGPVQSTDLRIAGEAPIPEGQLRPSAAYSVVSADYFRTVGMNMRRGRAFTRQDDGSAPRVAIVSEAMAEKFWPGQDAIGKRFTLSTEALRIGPRGQPSFQWDSAARTVVGIVGNIHHEALGKSVGPEAYLPYPQAAERTVSMAIRTAGDPVSLTTSLRREVRAVDPQQPISRVASMDAVIATATGEPRFRTMLVALFAGLAALLAAVGIYGLMAFAVTQRTREIGIRAALGANSHSLAGLILRDGVRLTIAGLVAGLAGAAVATRLLGGMLYQTQPFELPVFAAVTAGLGLVALLACYVPARRAARMDPVEALREQ